MRQAQPLRNQFLGGRLAPLQRRHQPGQQLGDLRGAVSEGNLHGRDGAVTVAQLRERPGGAWRNGDRRESVQSKRHGLHTTTHGRRLRGQRARLSSGASIANVAEERIESLQVGQHHRVSRVQGRQQEVDASPVILHLHVVTAEVAKPE